MDTEEFKLNGDVVELGCFQGDPFIDNRWPGIVAEVERRFPDTDLIIYQVDGAYTGLASISENLDPMKMATTMMSQGIMVMGSNKKVNIMSQQQFSDIVKLLEKSL